MLLTSKTSSAPSSDFSSACLTRREPIAVQPPVIDALLEIDPHDAERRQRAAPVVARVDVVGADLADRIVHGGLLRSFLSSRCGPIGAQGRPGYSKLFIAIVTTGLHNSTGNSGSRVADAAYEGAGPRGRWPYA